MTGDCSTCNHSLAAGCTQGKDGRLFLLSTSPNPCPVWEPIGEKWHAERKAWELRNSWSFKIAAPEA